MSLKTEIESMQREMLPSIPEDALGIMVSAMEKLVNSGIADHARKPGEAAPRFELENTKGEQVALNDLLRKGPVVINFYRGVWCPYCNLELKAWDRAMPEVRALGAELVSISPNLREKSAAFVAENPFDFKILSDRNNRVAKEYGLVFELARELRPIYEKFGINLPEYDGNERYELPMPATYVVASDGIIRHAFVNADYTQRMEPDEVITILQGMADKE